MLRYLFAFALTSGCFLDATAEHDGSSTTSEGAGGALVGGAGGSGPGGAPPTSTGGGPSGAGGEGGGGAPPDLCGNGVVDGPDEECEDGDDDDNDGCVDCRSAGECGDEKIGPGEECSQPAAEDCSDTCQLTGGACFGLPPLAPGVTTGVSADDGDAPFTDLAAAGCAGADPDALANHYVFDSGPYPRGFYVYLVNSASTDPLAYATLGCGEAPIACDYGNDTALIYTPLLEPHSQVFVGVGDDRGGSGDFTSFIEFYRYFERFLEDPKWTLEGGWTFYPNSFYLYNAGTTVQDNARAISTSYFVGGLGTARVSVTYALGTNAATSARLAYSFDDGATFQPLGEPLAPSATAVTVERILQTEGNARVKLALEFTDPVESAATFVVVQLLVLEPRPE